MKFNIINIAIFGVVTFFISMSVMVSAVNAETSTEINEKQMTTDSEVESGAIDDNKQRKESAIKLRNQASETVGIFIGLGGTAIGTIFFVSCCLVSCCRKAL